MLQPRRQMTIDMSIVTHENPQVGALRVFVWENREAKRGKREGARAAVSSVCTSQHILDTKSGKNGHERKIIGHPKSVRRASGIGRVSDN